MARLRGAAHKNISTPPGELEFELTLGVYGHCGHLGGWPCPDPFECGLSVYESEEQREATYWHYRELLLANPCGRRPAAWWWYEADSMCRHRPRCAHPDRIGEEQTEWLAYHGCISAQERAMLLRHGGPTWQPYADALLRGEQRRSSDHNDKRM